MIFARIQGNYCGSLLVLAVLCFCVGCGAKDDEGDVPASGLTESQRDSVLAESQLPGAGTVGQARALADSAAVRAQRAEEVGR